MDLITPDKNHYEYCLIDTKGFLESTLGAPINLPDELEDLLSEGWLINQEKALLAYLQRETGIEYERVLRDNSCNHESDLDLDFVYTVFAPVGNSDWLWDHSVFVAIELAQGVGDPRSLIYGSADIYHLLDNPIAESGFFNWMIEWQVSRLVCGEHPRIDELNERLSAGYSNNPTSELSEMVEGELEWSPTYGGYIGHLKDFDEPVLLSPYASWFG